MSRDAASSEPHKDPSIPFREWHPLDGHAHEHSLGERLDIVTEPHSSDSAAADVRVVLVLERDELRASLPELPAQAPRCLRRDRQESDIRDTAATPRGLLAFLGHYRAMYSGTGCKDGSGSRGDATAGAAATATRSSEGKMYPRRM